MQRIRKSVLYTLGFLSIFTFSSLWSGDWMVGVKSCAITGILFGAVYLIQGKVSGENLPHPAGTPRRSTVYTVGDLPKSKPK